LDSLVQARFQNGFDVLAQVADDVYTYAVVAPSGISVSLGHSYGVHIWVEIDGNWRWDSHADDLASLTEEFENLLDLSESILRGELGPPGGPSSRRDRWNVPEFDVMLRGMG